MRAARFVLALSSLCLINAPTQAGTIYHAYPGDNLNALDEVLVAGDTLLLHEGTYEVDPATTAGGRIWMTNKHGDDPNTPEVEWITIKGAEGEARPRLYYATNARNMIDINGTTDHIRVQRLEIEGGSMAARLGPGTFNDIIFEDLHLHHNPDGGINLSGVSSARNVRIRLNHLHNIGSEAMYIGRQSGGGVSDALIELNLIHDIVATDPHGDGIELKYGDYNCLVQDNVICRTSLPGVLTYGTGRNNWAECNVVRRNAIYQAGDAGIQTTAETILENNLIVNSPSRGIAVQLNTAPDMRYLRIVNNTVYATFGVGLKLSSLAGQPIIIANNAIYQQIPPGWGLAVEIVDGLPPTAVVASNYYRGQTAGLDGVAGFIEGNLPADEFLNTSLILGQLDLYPKQGSSLVDAGDNASAPTHDFNKLTPRPQNGVVDVGAYEQTSPENPGWQFRVDWKRMLDADLDGDCDADMDDFRLFANAFYGQDIEAGNPLADLDDDGDCDLAD